MFISSFSFTRTIQITALIAEPQIPFTAAMERWNERVWSDLRVKGLMYSLNGGVALANHGARTLMVLLKCILCTLFSRTEL